MKPTKAESNNTDAHNITAAPQTVNDFFALFESQTNLEKTVNIRQYRLERMKYILQYLDNPQTDIPIIHIAGSKGKSSTAAYTASLLAGCGLRIGMYTSPHVTNYRERFVVLQPYQIIQQSTVNQDKHTNTVAEDILLSQCRRVWQAIQTMQAHGYRKLPTTFELLTALAFCCFQAVQCSYVVLETGLGGRLDATNICSPLLCILTHIELEHTEYLGTTLRSVAREKAGIIKQGIPVIAAAQHPEAHACIQETAAQHSAALTVVTKRLSAQLRMISEAQQYNAALAVAAVQNLCSRGYISMPKEQQAILQNCQLAGRGEVIGNVVLDGAHTPHSLANILQAVSPNIAFIIFGVTKGKDVEKMAQVLLSIKKPETQVIVTQAGSFKPASPHETAAILQKAGIAAHLEPNTNAAFTYAQQHTKQHTKQHAPDRYILITGSFYLAAALRPSVLSYHRQPVCNNEKTHI